MPENLELATFAGGCFWCTEAIFQRLKGVEKVVSGYTGGELKSPSYEKVSMGNTGHAEAIQISFNPKIIDYQKLLEVFMATHDPTTLNQQGADIGSQYRSAIFYHNDQQKTLAEKLIRKFTNEEKYPNLIVTKVEPAKEFYPAENYHQDYFNNNSYAPYCQVVIDPKVKKLLLQHSDEVKDEYK